MLISLELLLQTLDLTFVLASQRASKFVIKTAETHI
jgi:NADH:ubiquinone oxidoreductase subunit K